MKKILLIIGFIFTSFAANLVWAANNTATTSDPNKTIMLNQKQTSFTLTLASNPTTGYSWFLKNYDSQFITVTQHSFQAPKTNLVGASGQEIWVFKVNPSAFLAPHIFTINMLYARPWNINDNSKEITFTVVTH